MINATKKWNCPICNLPHDNDNKDIVLKWDDLSLVLSFYRCTCGLIYSDFAVKKTTPDIYGQKFYSHTRYTSDDSRKSVIRHLAILFNSVVKNTQIKKDNNVKYGKLLDVGCATGDFVSYALKNDWDAEGIDISDEAVAIGKARGLSLKRGSALDLKNKPNTYNMITLWDVIEHTPNPKDIFNAIFFSLRSQGILLLTTISSGSLIEKIARLLYRISKGHIQEPLKRIYAPGHIYAFTEKTLNILISRKGWENIYFKKINTPSDVIFSKKQLLLRISFIFVNWIQKITGMSQEFYVAFQKK